jgi:hypothetical protein
MLTKGVAYDVKREIGSCVSTMAWPMVVPVTATEG